MPNGFDSENVQPLSQKRFGHQLLHFFNSWAVTKPKTVTEKKMQNLAHIYQAFWDSIRTRRSQVYTSPMGRSANPARDLHSLHLHTKESLLAPHSYIFQLSKHIYTTQMFTSLTMWDIAFFPSFSMSISILWASISHSPDNHFKCMNIRF